MPERQHTKPTREFLQSTERKMLTAYRDKNLKSGKTFWAIGYGSSEYSNPPFKVHEGMKISESKAEELLDATLAETDKQLNAKLSDRARNWLYQDQWNALVSIAYNKGSKWVKDVLGPDLEAGRWEAVSDKIRHTVPHTSSAEWFGLSRRREGEARMFERSPMKDILLALTLPRSYFK